MKYATDSQVATGNIPAWVQVQNFDAILGWASRSDTGVSASMPNTIPKHKLILYVILQFIALQHDSSEAAVQLAIGYTLRQAMNHNSSFSVRRSLY
jgi:hypothetical protein